MPKRCPTCGQVIPYGGYVRWMALGTWRKQKRDRPGYIKWRHQYHQILKVEPHKKEGWRMPMVTVAETTLLLGPTVWVYERLPG